MDKTKFSFKSFNKEIYLLRLAIITECNLRCKYCFVEKTNKITYYLVAKKAIELFLNSPGNKKVFIIYGGEPLLCFSLIKKIIFFAQREANLLKKYLIISVGTNGILLKQKQLIFFRKKRVKLSISLDGQKQFHNKARVFKNQKGTFNRIVKQLPLILKNIPKGDVCVLFGVLPSSAYKMYDNLIFLTKLGFDSINIEPVQNKMYPWNKKQKIFFLLNLIKFIHEIYNNIATGNFIFLNSINRELKNRRLSDQRKNCPFFETLEVYPGGEMAFSPFLINSKFKDQYVIGNIKKSIQKKYLFCKYDLNKDECKNCRSDYYKDGDAGFKENQDLLDWRNRYSIYLSKRIYEQSKKIPIFKKYIKESRKRIFE